MSWSDAAALKAQVLKLWERGELLREMLAERSRFPLRLVLKVPGSADIAQRFDAVRTWAAALFALEPVRIEWQQVRHRVQGTQHLPASAWLDSLDSALGWIGKRAEAARYAELIATTRLDCPALLPWLAQRPLQALALAGVWQQLLAVVLWLSKNPRPGLYLRQVDLPGIHSKFIEVHRSVLTELLDLALPAEAIDFTRSGTGQFAGRYGFKEKPSRLRFRLLDPAIQPLGSPCPDITLDAASFSRLALPVTQVFITENETNFLAFAQAPRAMVIFGAGYGWEALAQAQWLNGCTLHYWGDIDTHGFAILSQLRGRFAHVESFLMDERTLLEHEPFWGTEAKQSLADLSRLTEPERAIYDTLRDNRIRPGLRLEQEYIGFNWVTQHVQALTGQP